MSARLARGASWMLAAATATNLCMLAYHRAMSLKLGDAYAELAALTAALNVVGVASLGASATLVKLFSSDAASGGAAAAKGRLLAFLPGLGRAMLGTVLAAAVAAPLVVRYLALGGFAPYALASAALALGLATLASRAALQGAGLFGALSLSVAAEGLCALAGAVAFVSLGAGPAGALGGVACGEFAALAVCAAALRAAGPASLPSSRTAGPGEVAADAAALGLFTLIAHLDLFTVKHLYDAGPAAGYARAAIVAKSLLYLAAALDAVLLPAASEALARGDARLARGLLLRCLAAAVFLLCAGLTTIGRFTPFVVRLLCGSDPAFLALVPLIRAYSAAVVPLALVQPVLYYLLATRDRRVLPLLAATAAVYACALRAAAGDPYRTVLCLAGASTALLGGALILVWTEKPA